MGQSLEIVVVSSERDEAFASYHKEMPCPASSPSRGGVGGILTRGAPEPEGKLITTRGRAALSADPDGKAFSNWGLKPPSQKCSRVRRECGMKTALERGGETQGAWLAATYVVLLRVTLCICHTHQNLALWASRCPPLPSLPLFLPLSPPLPPRLPLSPCPLPFLFPPPSPFLPFSLSPSLPLLLAILTAFRVGGGQRRRYLRYSALAAMRTGVCVALRV